MGIINLTPDSFSDGGNFFNDNASALVARQIEEYLNQNFFMIDLGAESTAPSNLSISESEEKDRFTILFSALDQLSEESKALLKKRDIFSIDTYRLETFLYVLSFLQQKFPGTNVCWNDVSGKGDRGEVLDFLKNNPTVKYVYCHNLAPSWALTSEHMKYAPSFLGINDWKKHLDDYFFKAYQLFKKNNLLPQIIFDPCFGFSKKRDDNWAIWDLLPDLIKSFDLPWLIGISRKSFLRQRVLQENPMAQRVFFDCEKMAQRMLNNLSNSIDLGENQKLIIRLHSPLSS